jgi:membrane protein implicated in regulation of membrane protease activity
MTLLWWHWLVVGLLLVLAEMATAGGFFVIFFGIGALVVGILAGLGYAGPLWMQLLLFCVISVLSLVLFRSRMLRWVQLDPQRPEVDALVGEIGIINEPVAPAGIGKVEVRGSAWNARNVSQTLLARGARCRVVRVDGLMLDVEPEGARS